MPEHLFEIARIIREDWKNIYFGASPYLNALFSLNNIHEQYGQDSARSVVVYFLANAGTWRGDTARAVKKHLNTLVKNAQR